MYILGRREVFESCYELRQAFELLLRRPDKLTLVTGEMWPSKRRIPAEASPEERGEGEEVDGESAAKETGPGQEVVQLQGEAVIEGVEHLGQYVFEMTKTRVQQLREERGLAGEVPVEMEVKVAEEKYGDLEAGDGGEEGEKEKEEVEEEEGRAARGEGFEVEED